MRTVFGVRDVGPAEEDGEYLVATTFTGNMPSFDVLASHENARQATSISRRVTLGASFEALISLRACSHSTDIMPHYAEEPRVVFTVYSVDVPETGFTNPGIRG